MTDPTIWCVVPFSRPRNLQLVTERFLNQTYQNKKLVVVENGPALGACEAAGVVPDLLLTSEPHQSYAKNEALLRLKEIAPDDYWTTMDDDDYYGPEYLQELSSNLSKGDIVGKLKSFIKLSDDRLYLIDKWKDHSLVEFVHGPTITARIADSMLFEVVNWGEDLDWMKEMSRWGATIYATSPHHWCYFRHGNGAGHAWGVTDDEFRFSNSGKLIDCGPFDSDIVNGKKEASGQTIHCHEFVFKGSAAYLRVMQDTGGEDFVKEAIAKAKENM